MCAFQYRDAIKCILLYMRRREGSKKRYAIDGCTRVVGWLKVREDEGIWNGWMDNLCLSRIFAAFLCINVRRSELLMSERSIQQPSRVRIIQH